MKRENAKSLQSTARDGAPIVGTPNVSTSIDAPWAKPAGRVASELDVDPKAGLSRGEAAARLETHGPNAFDKAPPEGVAAKALRQLRDIPNMILVVAAALSLALAIREGHGFAEPVVIMAVVLLNIVLAVTQERGAEKALDALSDLANPTCMVVRDGRRVEIASEDVVPGDILALATGDSVAADARLISASDLAADESSLTGESEPVEKSATVQPEPDAPVGDRLTMVHAGSLVTSGNATAVVTATGMGSEMGRIAGFLGATERQPTPLQRRLDRVSKAITAVALVAAAVLFVVGMRQGEDLWAMLLAAVSLAVAAVPETLQLIVTLSLAQGIRRMVAKNALIRKLPAVETLGSVSVVCSDKTGTLTQNHMSVRRVWVPGCDPIHVDQLSAGGEERARLACDSSAVALISRMALASNATVVPAGTDGQPTVQGDATERAIVELLLDLGLTPAELQADYPKVGEVPFSSSRKMMTSVHALPQGGYLVLTKGAYDHIPFAASSDEDIRGREEQHDRFAADALRVIALGSRLISVLPADGDLAALERDLTFEGMVGIIDPPRPEAARAIADARRAGIRTVMITGDHAATAAAIARQLGLAGEGDAVVTGRELTAMSDEELAASVRGNAVYARVSPEDKIRIVRAWQEQGEVVAMTGDGVNDAPALKAADVGIAMGVAGTEVAKAAADMVLTDDDFATIMVAVREGRAVFSNIRRTIYFLLTCNLSEIVIMLVAQLMGWGTALTPILLLLINVLGDGIPGLRLAYDTSDERIMARGPIGRDEGFFSPGIVRAIAQQTLAFAVVGLVAFWLGAVAGLPNTAPGLAQGQTMAFLVVAYTSITHAFTVRSRMSVFRRRVTDNWPLVMAVVAMLVTFTMLVAAPQVSAVFGLVALPAQAWLAVVALSIVPLALAEAVKLWEARRDRPRRDRRRDG